MTTTNKIEEDDFFKNLPSLPPSPKPTTLSNKHEDLNQHNGEFKRDTMRKRKRSKDETRQSVEACFPIKGCDSQEDCTLMMDMDMDKEAIRSNERDSKAVFNVPLPQTPSQLRHLKRQRHELKVQFERRGNETCAVNKDDENSWKMEYDEQLQKRDEEQGEQNEDEDEYEEDEQEEQDKEENKILVDDEKKYHHYHDHDKQVDEKDSNHHDRVGENKHPYLNEKIPNDWVWNDLVRQNNQRSDIRGTVDSVLQRLIYRLAELFVEESDPFINHVEPQNLLVSKW